MILPTIENIITSSTSDINAGISFFSPVIVWAFSIGAILLVLGIAINFMTKHHN